MGIFSKNGKEAENKEFSSLISEFTEEATEMVRNDKNGKKAIILIAVEENESGDGVGATVFATGKEANLVYGLTQFMRKSGTSELFKKAVGFLSFVSFLNEK